MESKNYTENLSNDYENSPSECRDMSLYNKIKNNNVTAAKQTAFRFAAIAAARG